ncbi:MAG TPA: hypothetical protein VFN48_11270 [Solirubrobacteraceae bacterium]|nr:hypothetical protein [Solirubrobacteraceae bacterium]
MSADQHTSAAVNAVATHQNDVPPAGEDIHLPPGTPIPLLIAVGITMALVGSTTSWLWTYIGGAVFLVALVIWIRDTIAEVRHLPEEHVVPTGHGSVQGSTAHH